MKYRGKKCSVTQNIFLTSKNNLIKGIGSDCFLSSLRPRVLLNLEQIKIFHFQYSKQK